jgi:hypothetical protein
MWNLFGCLFSLLTGSSESAFNIFLKCVKAEMGDKLTRLHTVMVDKCDAERNAIKAVLGETVRVRLCYWHLMYAFPVALIVVSSSIALTIVGVSSEIV